MMFRTIRWEIKEDKGFLILDQPPSNGMSKAFFTELKRLTEDVIPCSEVSSVIIHGSGRHFSSGANIDDLLGGIRDGRDEYGVDNKRIPDFLEENNRTFLYFSQLNVPVIAAIQGVCLGSAMELALFCHFRVCAAGSLMALPEVSFNLMPGCGGTVKLPEITGSNRALELMLEGRNFSAQEAKEWGIADIVVPKRDLLSTAAELADIASKNFRPELKQSYLKQFQSLRHTKPLND